MTSNSSLAATGIALSALFFTTSQATAQTYRTDPEIRDLIQGCINQNPVGPEQCIRDGMNEYNERLTQEGIATANAGGQTVNENDVGMFECIGNKSTELTVDNYQLSLDIATKGIEPFLRGTDAEYQTLRDFFEAAIKAVEDCSQANPNNTIGPKIRFDIGQFDEYREKALQVPQN